MDDIDDEALRKLRREEAIRMRVAEADKKREEEQEQKRLDLERKRGEIQRKEREVMQRQLNAASSLSRARAAKKAEKERLDRSRTGNIERDNKQWLQRENSRIEMKKKDALEEFEKEELFYEGARQRKCALEDEAREERIETVRHDAELDGKRADRIQDKDTQRDIKELHNVDKIKSEAHEELQCFMMNPAPVPLKQVLAGRIRPVPTVTELLAAHKDQREDLELLENADLPCRAMLKNQTLFQYVRDLRESAEKNQIRPPEPSDGDLGRSKAKGKKGLSPKGTRTLSPKGRKKVR